MEVGAVKQAFNNEIILLKKNTNQAKIQTIHKLTRKAKTFTEKKVPEAQKEKFKRKAESAVKEVLIIKKIKARDIARFIVTHTGKLIDFINKPIVDNDKAYARLLLHKSLQEKYKYIRAKFSEIPIKDLFMSRQERRKLKKEEREKQKNKKKGKDKNKKSAAVSVEGEWDVEMTDEKNNTIGGEETSDDLKSESENGTGDENDNSDDESGNSDSRSDIDDISELENDQSITQVDEEFENVINSTSVVARRNESDSSSDETNNYVTTENKIKLPKISNSIKSIKTLNKHVPKDLGASKSKTDITKKVIDMPTHTKEDDLLLNAVNKKNSKKNINTNKNKNLKIKLENRNFHKEINETPNVATKMVDPFFITTNGENYMSLVEPRPPDEVKEDHKQGNRQYRRAIMFGHAMKVKPNRNNQSRNKNFEKNKTLEIDNKKFNRNKKFDEKPGFKRNPSSFQTKDNIMPEKLHPSWEAKKKRSGILPFEGKKILFDES